MKWVMPCLNIHVIFSPHNGSYLCLIFQAQKHFSLGVSLSIIILKKKC